MYALGIILQNPGTGNGAPDALGYLNSVGLSVFLVGIGFILLLVAHWYRMKDNISRKENIKMKHGEKGADITQFQYMTRSELKEMVLREKEKKEALESEVVQADPDNEHKQIEIPTSTPSAAMVYRGRGTAVPKKEQEPESKDETPGIEEIKSQEPHTARPKAETSPKAELLGRLAMQEALDQPEEDEGKPKKPPPNPYHDKIERSILSNEPLDTLKGRSRKI